MAEQVAASSHLMCAISEPLKIRTTNSLLDWQLAQMLLLLHRIHEYAKYKFCIRVNTEMSIVSCNRRAHKLNLFYVL